MVRWKAGSEMGLEHCTVPSAWGLQAAGDKGCVNRLQREAVSVGQDISTEIGSYLFKTRQKPGTGGFQTGNFRPRPFLIGTSLCLSFLRWGPCSRARCQSGHVLLWPSSRKGWCELSMGQMEKTEIGSGRREGMGGASRLREPILWFIVLHFLVIYFLDNLLR